MVKTSKIEEFWKTHHYPDKCGINSLYRFYKIDLDQVDHLEHLFYEKKLYHSLPSQFNDPFECRPHFIWPTEIKKVRAIKKKLERLARDNGVEKKNAKTLVSDLIKDKELLKETLNSSTKYTYSKIRVCSFTTHKSNLLLWSHYANSHKGFCVEFDATKMPISCAHKVQYEDQYPEVIYPTPGDETALIPALVKSKAWKYENEFRTILYPGIEYPSGDDGESVFLKEDMIKNVYLGSNIDEDNKKLIFDLVKNGEFRPGIWIASLAESTFSLKFTKVDQTL